MKSLYLLLALLLADGTSRQKVGALEVNSAAKIRKLHAAQPAHIETGDAVLNRTANIGKLILFKTLSFRDINP